MKNFISVSSFSTLLFLLVIVSCKKADYSLGELPSASEIDYEVIQDFGVDPGGNTVILKYNSMNSSPVWDYETGKSNRAIDTVRYAFAGTYTISLTAITQGGTLELEPVVIEVTEDNLNYVNDPLWTALSGGVGNSKVWLLDLDQNGVSKYFNGPLYFSGKDLGWEYACLGDEALCWWWEADWPGNTWIGDAGDYGTMTFSLDGGPFVTVDHKFTTARGVEMGTYFLDADAKTLTMVDAAPLQNSWADNDVDNWTNFRLISLNEDALQIGAFHASKDELVIFNFISKSYSDNWVPDDTEPEVDEGFDPTFEPGELLEMLTGGPSSGRVWKLDADGNPVDWLASGIGWTADPNSSWDWGWNQGWIDIASNSWIRFDRFGGTLNYTLNQNGVETTSTFTIDEETNEIILDGNTLIQNPDSWMNPTTNTIKVIKAYDDFEARGIWFGTGYDAVKDEWLVFHYVL